MSKRLLVGVLMYLAMLATAPAAYEGWQHAGSLYILTTPEGANLPATAAEDNFPLLVRLNKDAFDFSQAKTNGDDLRFSMDGAPLPYQIEEWDALAGTASIWVKIPRIKGNVRQEIKIYWGKGDAASESSGPSVFNATNGYCCVMHLNGNVLDSTGSISPVNLGASPTTAVIGSAAYNLDTGKICATNILNFPTGKTPSSSSEVWLRAKQIHSWCMPMVWGNKNAYGWKTWIMQIGFWQRLPILPSPLYCRGAGQVKGSTALVKQQWYHVVYTTSEPNGPVKLYINGVLDATGDKGATLIANPQSMVLGDYGGDVDVDEARISSVTRSADWVKMSYENQKPLQTLAGCLVQPGSSFLVSDRKLTVKEGQSATVTAKAGGALRVCWIIKKDGVETIVAVDKFSYTIEAGRVTGDQAYTLQFKAIFADQVKTLDIPVTILEDMPDPVFTLQAPSKWNGRDLIEIAPKISNLKDMQLKKAGELKYDWKVSGLAVSKAIEPGKLILTRSQNSGKLAVTLTMSNGNKLMEQTAVLAVTEPKNEPWVQRTPDPEDKPAEGQFYARDDKNEGTLYYNGTLRDAADAVFLKLYADDKLIKTENQKLAPGNRYAFSLKLKPGLIKYTVEFGSKNGDAERILDTVPNLVCGDAYLINGQSNAEATNTAEQSPPETNAWIRSYGGPTGRGDATSWARDQFKVKERTGRSPNLWCCPVWKTQKGENASLGWWGMELAKRLVASQKIPIFIVNGAVGGTRIDEHQPCATNHLSMGTMYGRTLWRVQQAKLTHGIRGVIWHQGENDQGLGAPTGDYDWKSYQENFLELSAAWKQDFPNIQHYYTFQIWPNACSMGGDSGCGDMIRERQRTMPRLFANMDCMSTLGVKPPGGCHFPLVGWSEFARLIQPLIERDNSGVVPKASITAPNLEKASYANATKDAITLEFDQPVVWNDALISEFYLDGAPDLVASGRVSGNVITLKLKPSSPAKKITYLHEFKWSQDRLIMGANNIAALTFADVAVESGQ